MAGNIIMSISSIVFLLLLIFLVFVFGTFILSLFKRTRYTKYEPSVSIVIPSYNEEKNIESCLDSVYALDYPKEKTEVIVVDDGSTDSSIDVLRNCKERYNGLVVVRAKHEGKSPSLNKGVGIASNDMVFTVDADVILEKDALKKLVQPFAHRNVGATNGSCVVRNKRSILGIFQNIEYHYNNLIKKSFCSLFSNGIWFYGAFACYRKKVLEEIGLFKKDTMTEDADISLEIYSHRYKTVNVHDAIGYVNVPSTLGSLAKQRTRWSIGVLQSLKKNRKLLSIRSNPSILFFFINQYWWSLFAVLSLPLIAYQVYYWLPGNMGTFLLLFMYLFRWFSLLGPIYVLYKIPEWGISAYSIFGVLSGIISAFLIISALYLFKDKPFMNNALAIFFYFPYTIILNTITVISLIKLIFLKDRHFIY